MCGPRTVESTNNERDRDNNRSRRRRGGRGGGGGDDKRASSKENEATNTKMAPRKEGENKPRRYHRKPRGNNNKDNGSKDDHKRAEPPAEEAVAAIEEVVVVEQEQPVVEDPPLLSVEPAADECLLAAEEVAENPYVSLVSKKIRAVKKKLSKIAALEKKVAETPNAALNDDQTELLKSRDRVQHSLGDLEALKAQIDEIADRERAPPARRPTEEHFAQTDQARLNQDRRAIERLLKLIHVVTKGNANLPTTLDYFCKSILGTAGLPDDEFQEALRHSVDAATLYLESSDAEIAPGVTYAHLEHIIETHAETLRPLHAPTTLLPA